MFVGFDNDNQNLRNELHIDIGNNIREEEEEGEE